MGQEHKIFQIEKINHEGFIPPFFKIYYTTYYNNNVVDNNEKTVGQDVASAVILAMN